MRELLPQWILIAAASLLLTLRQRQLPGWPVFAATALAAGGLVLVAGNAALPNDRPLQLDHLAFVLESVALGSVLALIAAGMRRSAESGLSTAQQAHLLFLLAGATLAIVAADLVVLCVAQAAVWLSGVRLMQLDEQSPETSRAVSRLRHSVITAIGVFVLATLLIRLTDGETSLAALEVIDADRDLRGLDHARRSPGTPLNVTAVWLLICGTAWQWLLVPFRPGIVQARIMISWPTQTAVVVLWRLAGLAILMRCAWSVFASQPVVSAVMLLLLVGATMVVSAISLAGQSRLKPIVMELASGSAALLLLSIVGEFGAAGFVNSEWQHPVFLTAKTTALLAVGADCVALVGLTAVLIHLGQSGRSIEHVDDLSGLAKTNLPAALSLIVLAMSLAGLPPVAGFWTRLFVLLSVMPFAAESPLVFVVLGLATVWFIAAGVMCLRIIHVVLFGVSIQRFDRADNAPAIGVAILCASICAGGGLLPGAAVQLLERMRM